MNLSDIERIVDIISCDETEVHETRRDGKSITLVLRNPTPREKARAAHIYSREFAKAKIKGLPEEDQAIVDYIMIGQWSIEQEEQIEGIREDIHKIKRGLLDLLFKVKQLEQARTLLRRAEQALLERILKRQKLLTSTAESHALMVSQRYLIGQITRLENGDRFWLSDEIFDDSESFTLIDNLCVIFFKTSRISVGAMRCIAKSQYWRSIWMASQKSGDLFGKPTSQLSENQRELVNWSCVYDNVYESYERPEKDIIEDDDLLDSWFIRQGEKIEDKCKKHSGDRAASQSKRKGGRNEQFIFADEEGANKVYGMNDAVARKNIQIKQRLVAEQESIKEQHMPDSQQEMRQIAVQELRKHVLKKN